jgi:lytic murein transglycosylase
LRSITFATAFCIATGLLGSLSASAATCGNNSAGFSHWVEEFRAEGVPGVDPRIVGQVLATVSYSRVTIGADRGQHGFKMSLDEFLKKRGGAGIAAQGRKLLARNPGLFAAIEQRYGVPPGPIITIWGMETGFGSFMGNTPTLSSVATLAYDCRRSEFFTDQFRAALKLVENGSLSINAVGAAHGEIGHTQFLPKNVLDYGVDGDGDGRVDLIRSSADALASTANFLRGHGWQPGQGYQPGQPNFQAIVGWNAATVYEQAIALVASQIDRR